ncbi:unnamed protein product [Mycena citricolor]|uniref:DUF6534 domain-containing protein n=1 Tax=Mycena citricolor TaxID=2018698 RepID=A0AAD2Q487_9AGAR|nr:unnamed protein product [Mycena citricolor]
MIPYWPPRTPSLRVENSQAGRTDFHDELSYASDVEVLRGPWRRHAQHEDLRVHPPFLHEPVPICDRLPLISVCSQLMYNAFVSSYGDILHWNRYGWTFTYEPAWTALIAALAQGFFLHRCWIVSKSIGIGRGRTGNHGFTRCGHRLDCGSRCSSILHGDFNCHRPGHDMADSHCHPRSRHFHRFDHPSAQDEDWFQEDGKTSFSISRCARSPIPPLSQEKTLSRVVRVTFETALITSLVALVDLLLYVIMGKRNSIHLAFQLVVGKTYNHSIMVTLLSQTRIRSELDSNSLGRMADSGSGQTKPHKINTGITVTRTQIRVADHLDYSMHSIKSMSPSERGEEERDANSVKDRIA